MPENEIKPTSSSKIQAMATKESMMDGSSIRPISTIVAYGITKFGRMTWVIPCYDR